MIRKRLRQYNIIKHLYDADTTAVSLIDKERKHLLILLHCGIIDFGSKGIILQLHQRGKWMTIPKIHCIHIVGCQHIQIFNP